uniref:Metallophosphoesterase 1like [Nasonia vitripennis] n=1 Tax=Lepeophtheirus salmonis TaxID=72036 RepID=A0A0K2USL0_LEPSM
MKNIAFAVTTLLLTCEFLVYYIVLLLNCNYPNLGESDHSLKVLFLADTHLLGSRNGHWFDKLRREWQMHRSFQTAVQLFSPDAIFILGDIFDEGKWCSDREFEYYKERFNSLFYVNKEKLFVLQGNHDIGFHFASRPHLNERFKNAFEGTKAVRKLTLDGIVFVLVNSMAFDRTDKCFLCKEGENELNRVNKSLNPKSEPQPILLQHFPLYRSSDAECEEFDEELEDRESLFREGYDCLSQKSTDYLMNMINPRLVLTGHTHHGCHFRRANDVLEITVPSFSWRNKNTPSFYLAKISQQDFSLEKCSLPPEDTVINLYCLGITLIVIYITYSRCRRRNRWIT